MAFEDRRLPTAAALLAAARETQRCTLYGCTGSAAILGLSPVLLTERVDHAVGWSTILQVTQGTTERYFF